MTLHPALLPSDTLHDCDTCFEESNGARKSKKGAAGGWTRVADENRLSGKQFDERTLSHKRGMLTEFGGVVSIEMPLSMISHNPVGDNPLPESCCTGI